MFDPSYSKEYYRSNPIGQQELEEFLLFQKQYSAKNRSNSDKGGVFF